MKMLLWTIRTVECWSSVFLLQSKFTGTKVITLRTEKAAQKQLNFTCSICAMPYSVSPIPISAPASKRTLRGGLRYLGSWSGETEAMTKLISLIEQNWRDTLRFKVFSLLIQYSVSFYFLSVVFSVHAVHGRNGATFRDRLPWKRRRIQKNLVKSNRRRPLSVYIQTSLVKKRQSKILSIWN